jgi:hypothetical protein
MTKQKGQPTSLDKLLNSGHEAAIDESLVDNTAIPHKTPLVITLSENGQDALLEMATIAVLEYQRDKWERAVADGTPLTGEIYSDVGAQEALYEVENMASFRYALVIVDVNHVNDFLADWYNANFNGTIGYRPGYDYFSVWTTVGEAKTKNYWHQTDEFNYKYYYTDENNNVQSIPWDDDDPCLILCSNKFIKWGFIDYRDTPVPDSEPEVEMLTRIQLTGTEHYFANDPNAWPNDAIAKVKLELQKIVNSNLNINLITSSINQAILNFNYNVIVGNINNPPIGGWPPGFTGGPNPDYIPPSPVGDTSWVDTDCATNPLWGILGTTDLILPAFLGGLPILTLPIPIQQDELRDGKAIIDAQILALGITDDVSKLQDIELCVVYAGMRDVTLQIFGFNTTSFKSEMWEVQVHNTDNSTYFIDLPPEEIVPISLFKGSVPIEGIAVPFQGVANIAVRTNNAPGIMVENYYKIDHFYLNGKVMPALFNDNNDPFTETLESPIIRFALKGYRLRNSFWSGAQLIGDINSPCTVGNISPLPGQGYYQADWLNASGADRDQLFTGTNWKASIVAVLLEIYCPAPSDSIWAGNGATGIGSMDAWANNNPLGPHNGGAGLTYFDEARATNRITYTWLKPPSGETFMGFSMFPVPVSCWVRIVAYKLNTGEIVVQDPAKKCSSVVYPNYPACPY